MYLKEDTEKGISFSVEVSGSQIHKNYSNDGWVVSYGVRSQSADTEANARAKMLIYLVENKHVTL
jgi:hypothetical protein